MSKIILASHGEFSKGLLQSVKMIVGPLADDVETYSLQVGENPSDYYEQLKQRIANTKEQFIILCDIKGGSVHSALSRLREYPNVVIFSGMNMGLVLDIVLHAQQSNLADYETLLHNAREGMTCIHGMCEIETDEDF